MVIPRRGFVHPAVAGRPPVTVAARARRAGGTIAAVPGRRVLPALAALPVAIAVPAVTVPAAVDITLRAVIARPAG
jgi:hypothetical protein